jgi:pimeloyl-ACP methyl ester carboxylesterase
MRTKANVQAIKNVVLVHGAFADGSGWKGVYKIPTAKGHDVTIVQNPATSLEDDVKATKAALDKQDRPAVLVGHSWSGAVITEAGNHANVASLVYVAAFQPVNGESTLQLFQSAPPAAENGVWIQKRFLRSNAILFVAARSITIPRTLFICDSLFVSKFFIRRYFSRKRINNP